MHLDAAREELASRDGSEVDSGRVDDGTVERVRAAAGGAEGHTSSVLLLV
jgi:hypothetical protein